MTRTPEDDGLEMDVPPHSEGTMAEDLETVDQRLRRSRLGVVVAAVAVLLVVGTAAAIVLLRHRAAGEPHAPPTLVKRLMKSTQREKPARSAAEALAAADGVSLYTATGEVIPGVVYVDSQPAGATVRLDGEVLGPTPLMVGRQLKGGTVTVELRLAGHRLWTRSVQVEEGGIRVDARLEPR